MARYFYDPRITCPGCSEKWTKGMKYMTTIYQWQWWYRFKWWYKYPIPITAVAGEDYRDVINMAKNIVNSYKNSK